MNYEELPRPALIALLQEHDAVLTEAGRDGIVMNYTGRAAPWQIIRLVKPKLCRILKKLSSVGDEKAQSENELWDGENLSAMVTLYKYRGQVDLILTDPPYNTGGDFRYNDKWDKDSPTTPTLANLFRRTTDRAVQQVAPIHDASHLDDARDAETGRCYRHLHRLPRTVQARHS